MQIGSNIYRESIDEVRAMATRRRFIGVAAATMISARINKRAWAADTKTGVPMRTLGHTGEKDSMVGIGGYHLASRGVEEKERIPIVRTASTRASTSSTTAGTTTTERVKSA